MKIALEFSIRCERCAEFAVNRTSFTVDANRGPIYPQGGSSTFVTEMLRCACGGRLFANVTAHSDGIGASYIASLEEKRK